MEKTKLGNRGMRGAKGNIRLMYSIQSNQLASSLALLSKLEKETEADQDSSWILYSPTKRAPGAHT